MLLQHTHQQRKAKGIHYTPRLLAERLAARMLFHFRAERETVTLLDPAVGDGELLASLVALSVTQGQRVRAEGYDTDSAAASLAEARLRNWLPPRATYLRSGLLG